MIEHVAPPQSGGLIPTLPLQFTEAHALARIRFKADPTKCYQRHIREVWGEIENRPQLSSLKGCRVEQVTREEAESIILKYEWLQSMGRGITACYGLKLDGELLGASCWGVMGGDVGNICGSALADRTVCLMRGACVPHAPKDAASFFTRHACRQAYKDFGWEIIFAYSDTVDAGEMGTIYQACNWWYVGEDLGRPAGSFHVDYQSPDGSQIVTSYKLNHQGREKKFMRSLGWTPEDGQMRPWLVAHGWTPIKRFGKKKWVWFEGPRKEELTTLCRYKPLPYPKRMGALDGLALNRATVH
jgi:hypothetical protein